MKYLSSEPFSTPAPSNEYRDNYDRIFRKNSGEHAKSKTQEKFIRALGHNPATCPVCLGLELE